MTGRASRWPFWKLSEKRFNFWVEWDVRLAVSNADWLTIFKKMQGHTYGPATTENEDGDTGLFRTKPAAGRIEENTENQNVCRSARKSFTRPKANKPPAHRSRSQWAVWWRRTQCWKHTSGFVSHRTYSAVQETLDAKTQEALDREFERAMDEWMAQNGPQTGKECLTIPSVFALSAF
ncbi:hypothetical protein F5Y17DRAFT_228801 [Xylariaceae sp. FL0594]|nr:hypothetical protein F5Y17DRAFT_228801 [Xylariaceae sp. FL0594]